MTSEVVPAAGGGPSSSTGTALRPRAPPRLAVVFAAPRTVLAAEPAPFLAADVRLVGDFLAAMVSVNGLGIRGGAGRIVESGALHHRTQIVERDAAVELQHRALDHVLELRGIERSGTGERQQMAPGFRGESPSLVRTQNAYHRVSS